MVIDSTTKPPAYLERSGLVSPIKWEPPPNGKYKFNVDGSYNKRNNSSACGGLLRDARGNLIQGFYCKLSASNSQCAEMWSLVHAVRMARQLQTDQVIFETDSSLVAITVLTRIATISYLKPLFKRFLIFSISPIGVIQFVIAFGRLIVVLIC
jgi:hypothetical protein